MATRNEDGFMDFIWSVPIGGFQVAEGRLHRPSGWDERMQPVLVPASPGGGVRRYRPLRDESALFLALAALSPEQESVLQWANQYGPLGLAISADVGGRPVQAEPLTDWQLQVQLMSNAVRLWELATAKDSAGIAREFFTWETLPDGRSVLSWQRTWWAGSQVPPVGSTEGTHRAVDAIGLFQHDVTQDAAQLWTGDVVQPALVLLRHLVNTQLRGRVSPELRPAVARPKPGPRPATPAAAPVMELQFVPATLLGCLWLQMARALSGSREYPRCEGCGRRFELSPTTSRADKRYCGDACRSRAYRARRNQAIPEKAKGKRSKTKRARAQAKKGK